MGQHLGVCVCVRVCVWGAPLPPPQPLYPRQHQGVCVVCVCVYVCVMCDVGCSLFTVPPPLLVTQSSLLQHVVPSLRSNLLLKGRCSLTCLIHATHTLWDNTKVCVCWGAWVWVVHVCDSGVANNSTLKVSIFVHMCIRVKCV